MFIDTDDGLKVAGPGSNKPCTGPATALAPLMSGPHLNVVSVFYLIVSDDTLVFHGLD